MIRRAGAQVPQLEPHVAVVVPCYNYGRFLTECVESIVNQTGVRTSVHVIDDASTDDSFVVAERLADRYEAVSVTRHETNRGHIATYNEGLSAVESDYVVLLSADDLLAPGALGRATSLMEAYPNVGLVYGHPQVFTDQPKRGGTNVRSWSVWPGERWVRAQFNRGLGIIYSPEAVVRTSVHHSVGYYRAELPHSGDLEMWLRVAAAADVGRVNGPDQAYRRVHPESMMQTGFGTVAKDLEERFRAYQSFLETADGKQIRGALVLAEMARRRASTEALYWAASVDPKDHSAEDEVQRAVEFAHRVNADVTRMPAWQAYQKCRTGNVSGIRERLLLAQSYLDSEVGGRLRWRRWQRYGY
ncbi:glycosyltransferase family 2 protein [Arthrobacter dokdonensis]|uniref:glycosyltransferase family 2 protein n=1 Tax=Arthrobacter dokdonellae TaxID=2211210 RepID=UPI000DE57E65|nr:glycosyltransferase family A protein [Arthrobacter dokdonellae]